MVVHWEFDRVPSILKSAVIDKNYYPGELIFCQGNELNALYVVRSGRIRIERYTFEGNSITINVLRPGEIFGISVLSNTQTNDNAYCEMEARIAIYPKKQLLSSLRNDQRLSQTLTQHLLYSNFSMRNSLELREIRQARGRVIHYLKSLSASGDKTIHFDRSYKDIAREMGLTPESFYRTLSKLQHDGIITRYKQTIILNHDIDIYSNAREEYRLSKYPQESDNIKSKCSL